MNGTDSSSVVSNDSHSFVFGSNDDKTNREKDWIIAQGLPDNNKDP